MNLEFHNYYGDLAFAYPHQNHLKVKPLLEWFSQEDSSPQSFKIGKNPASKLAKSTHPSISQTVWLRTILIIKSNDLHICLNNIYHTYQVGAHFKALDKGVHVAPFKTFEIFFHLNSPYRTEPSAHYSKSKSIYFWPFPLSPAIRRRR